MGRRVRGTQTQKKWGFERWGFERWLARNFALFFPLSRRKIRSLLPSLGVFSWNFGDVRSAGRNFGRSKGQAVPGRAVPGRAIQTKP